MTEISGRPRGSERGREAAALLSASGIAGALGAYSPVAALAASAAILAALGAITLSPLASAALLSASSFLSGWSLPVGEWNVRPEQVAGPLVALGVLFRRRAGAPPRLGLFVLAWLAAGVFGAIGEPETGRAMAHGVRLAATTLPFFLLPMLLRTRDESERAWNGFLFLTVLESAFGLAALTSHDFFGTTWGMTFQQYLGYHHPHGTLLEPNLLGMLSAASAAALLVRSLDASRPNRMRILFFFGFAISAAATAVSLTRAAWIALPAVALPAIVFAPSERRRQHWRFAALTALALLAAAATLLITHRDDGFGALPEARLGVAGKIASLSRAQDDPNVRVRLRSYEAALEIWRASPLLGAGHGAMERLRGGDDKTLAWAGNLEIHLLVDTGVTGLMLILTLTGTVAFFLIQQARSARSNDERGRAIERLAVLAVVLICAQATETSWLASFWIVFGLSVASTSFRGKHVPAQIFEPSDVFKKEGESAPASILFVHPSDELYGSDRVLLELVGRLDRNRFRPVVVVSTDFPYAGRLSRRLAEDGVRVYRLRIGILRRRVLSPLRAPRYAIDVALSTLRLARLMKRERIRLVHANTVTVFPAAFAARLAGIPLLWHVHEIVTDRTGRGVVHFLVRKLATRIVVVSEAARASLDPDRSNPEIEIIHNGIDAPAGEPGAPRSAVPLIAYVGRLSTRKGPHILLRAFAKIDLTETSHPPRLIFAGDQFGGGNALADTLALEAESLGIRPRVDFRPFDEDVSDLLEEAWVVASPSILPESFGLILLEAMAAGRPVVASDHGGPREVVADGETGFLVPPGDDTALANALQRILGDRGLAREMGSAARKRARERYHLGHSVERFEEIFSDLLEIRRAR